MKGIQPETEAETCAQTPSEAPSHLNTSPLATTSVLALSATVLSACGGGGGGGGGSGGGGISPPPPPPVPVLTELEATRFLLQAQFSATDAEATALRNAGYDNWLNTQFNTAPSRTGVAFLDSIGHNEITSEGRYFWPQYGDFMIWNQLLTGSDQMRKRMALALSEFFVVSLTPLDGFWPGYAIAAYWDHLTANAFGNFRTLLEEITLNPAMGFFLNTRGNLKADAATGRVPDENYAREVMQLFTIGLHELNSDGTEKKDSNGNPIDTYTQSDITNLARVFTGYDHSYARVQQTYAPWVGYHIPSTELVRDRMALTATNHSPEAVDFLGTHIPANTSGAAALKTALDTLFNHPNTGPFFARQMIQRLITSNPSPAYVGRVAEAFANNGSGVRGDLKAVWRAILTDTEARTLNTDPKGGKIREPMVRFVQFVRTFGHTSTNGRYEVYDTSSSDNGLGQSPLRSPSVFNFFRPGYVPPNTALATDGHVAPEFQIHNETTTAGYINFLNWFIPWGYNDVRMTYTDLSRTTDATALVDWLNMKFTANQLSADTRTTIREAINTMPSGSDDDKRRRLHAATLLVMASPEYLVQK